MKKFLSLFLIMQLLLGVSSPAFCATKIKTIKENNKYCVIDKSNKQILIPCEYDNIKKLSDDVLKVQKGNKSGALSVNNEIIIPVEYTNVVARTVKKNKNKYTNYYGIDAQNNLIYSKLFNDNKKNYVKRIVLGKVTYPTKNIIIAVKDYNNKKANKVGFIRELAPDTFITIPAEYDDYYFPDEKSLIKQTGQVSYFSDYIITKKNNQWGVIDKNGKKIIDFNYDKILTFDATVDEDMAYRTFGYDIIYKKIDFPVKDKFIAFKNNEFFIINSNNKILYKGEKPVITYDEHSLNLIKDIYSQNNAKSAIKFYNFPSTGIVKYKQGDNYGLIYVTDKKVLKTKPIYKDIYFPDDNTLVYNLLGISYAPPEQVWGLENSFYHTILGSSVSIEENALSEYEKPAITFDNEVLMLNGYVKITSKNIKTLNPNFKKTYIKKHYIDSTQKTFLGDVGINASNKNSNNTKISPVFPGYFEDTTLFKIGRGAFYVISAPLIITYPFVLLWTLIAFKDG